MNILAIVVVTFIVTFLGGGLGYFLWIKSRPKKQTWVAEVYQLTEGVRQPQINKEGKVISKLTLHDLKPYALDVLERLELGEGRNDIFRLFSNGAILCYKDGN